MNNHRRTLYKNMKKGKNATNLIIGGSDMYAGAPYFASISSLRTGSDLSFIMTQKKVLIPLKILLPESIVIPIQKTEWILNRINVCVIGPGLGRVEGFVADKIIEIANYLLQKNIPIIIDGDGINWLIQHLDRIYMSGGRIIVTPNFNEAKKLVGCNLESFLVVEKGDKDMIYGKNFNETVCDENSLKRCGGQGDILVGIMATLLSYVDDFEEFDLENKCTEACRILRKTSNIAYKKYGLSLMARDIIENLKNINKY
ncbi:hypothetical protein EDEG_02833 [Edhazardia aedis USNM 41457]|uniref:ATP-dependent (S)-NAD(P)H-hydrate dehydratase n=1 Tax=Edhazardia aedis (strain USNM 41457) TaxID=1003232 RepID=J9DJH8_EDHAE|nr:hypothetical protein EDEG_02833 [Edhazardia aedis USNM 41457]|eukprot:EJW02770.1 hypothetical protein EDEG_02833 [Edhazardia aedis USNM 41457]